jgi:hypothetical protein
MIHRCYCIASLIIIILLAGFLVSCSSSLPDTPKISDAPLTTATTRTTESELAPTRDAPPGKTPAFTPSMTEVELVKPEATPLAVVPVGTPTRLPVPHIISILDWELVEDTSPPLCQTCDSEITVVEAPEGLAIAAIQVFIEGDSGSESRLSTDLLYPDPETLECTMNDGNPFCGLIFGQVYPERVELQADYVAGDEHRLRFIITFQAWADYSP